MDYIINCINKINDIIIKIIVVIIVTEPLYIFFILAIVGMHLY